MRALAMVVLAGLVLSMPAVAAASGRHRHVAGLRHQRLAQAYHIPRFNQGEAEDFVHTAYPYRTGLYVPWPDAYGAPYYPYYYPY